MNIPMSVSEVNYLPIKLWSERCLRTTNHKALSTSVSCILEQDRKVLLLKIRCALLAGPGEIMLGLS